MGNSEANPTLRQLYEAMLRRIDPGLWWPAETRFEVLIGAILVQQTRWENAANSISNLAQQGLLTPHTLAEADPQVVRSSIAPSGFMTAKTRALRAIAAWAVTRDAEAGPLSEVGDAALREELLTLPGVGPETADAMLLYAFEREVFVADAYARRLFAAVGLPAPADYASLRKVAMRLAQQSSFNLAEFKAIHALIDEYGKLVREGKQSYEELAVSVRPTRFQ